MEITFCVLSDDNGIKPEINNKNFRNCESKCQLNNMLPNDQWVNQEIKKEIKKFYETNKKRNPTYQNIWHTAKQC
jgi:hypothetical protein